MPITPVPPAARTVALAAAAAALALAGCGGDSPRDAVKAYEEALGSGRIDDACKLLTRGAIKEMGGMDRCRASATATFRSALDTGEIARVEKSGVDAWFVDIHFDRNRKRQYIVRKEDGELKVALAGDSVR